MEERYVSAMALLSVLVFLGEGECSFFYPKAISQTYIDSDREITVYKNKDHEVPDNQEPNSSIIAERTDAPTNQDYWTGKEISPFDWAEEPDSDEDTKLAPILAILGKAESQEKVQHNTQSFNGSNILKNYYNKQCNPLHYLGNGDLFISNDGNQFFILPRSDKQITSSNNPFPYLHYCGAGNIFLGADARPPFFVMHQSNRLKYGANFAGDINFHGKDKKCSGPQTSSFNPYLDITKKKSTTNNRNLNSNNRENHTKEVELNITSTSSSSATKVENSADAKLLSAVVPGNLKAEHPINKKVSTTSSVDKSKAKSPLPDEDIQSTSSSEGSYSEDRTVLPASPPDYSEGEDPMDDYFFSPSSSTSYFLATKMYKSSLIPYE